MGTMKLKWAIRGYRKTFQELKEEGWGVGIGWSNYFGEHYLYVSLGIVGITVGKQHVREEVELV